ncbi:glycosyltransferase family 4 protein [Acidovorax sp. M2(2025)]|uniref:glycosyltransferase family 4 protein n=1 Tax=Acidovorax sp. M2(2025) TaxID=3411355 RepID=UPI003BF5434B
MRIVIDMQGAQSDGNRHRGIGRYVFEFAKAMCRNRGEHEILLALNGAYADSTIHIRDEFKGLIPQENIRVWRAPGPLNHLRPDVDGRRSIAEQVRLAFLRSLEPAVVINGAIFEAIDEDSVVTVEEDERCGYATFAVLYDLIPLIHPEIYLNRNPAVETWYAYHLKQLKRCDHLLAISESSRVEAMEYLHWPADRITNISSAVGAEFTPGTIRPDVAEDVRARLGLHRPFVMYTGGMDHRKNVLGLVHAYAALPPLIRAQHQLAIVCRLSPGQLNDIHQLVQKLGLESDAVVLTGFVSDADLLTLYRLCKLFVFPSWHEGFGLPLLEAMSCGRAALAGNVSAMPEVAGTPEALFDPHNPKSIASKMKQALSDDAFRSRLETHALLHRRNFSWDITAQRAFAALGRYLPGEATGGPESLPALMGRLQALPQHPPQDAYRLALAQMLDRNFPPTASSRQLFVDVTELARGDARTGIQRVVRSILGQWLRNPPEGFSVVPVRASNDGAGYHTAHRFKNAFLGQLDDSEEDSPVAFYNGDVFIGLDLQSDDVTVRAGFFEQMRVWGVSVYFVVYDLLPVQLPECFPDGSAAGHARWLATVARTDGAMCISQAVAEELRAYLQAQPRPPHPSFRIEWFHLGADIEESSPSKGMPPDAASVLAQIKRAPTFLMVGTLEPRKGHDQALQAMESLWASGVNAHLVIVGKAGWKTEELGRRIETHPFHGERLFWLQGISDEYLDAIYHCSDVLLVASKGEGFGLPLIEAAQKSLPIIARDIPVFREVAGASAYYFKGEEPAALAEALNAWLDLYESEAHPVSTSMAWLTWSDSARQLFSRF